MPGAPDPVFTVPDTDRIAQRAFARYESRGREDGRDLDDWLEAERELRQGVSSSTTPGAAPRTGSNEDS